MFDFNFCFIYLYIWGQGALAERQQGGSMTHGGQADFQAQPGHEHTINLKS